MNKQQGPRSVSWLAAVTLAIVAPRAVADAPPANDAVVVKKKVNVDRRMTLAPQKPNGSGIVVRYRLEGTPAAGRTLAVDLALERIVGNDASVRFEADRGLRLPAGAAARQLTAGQKAALTVDVVPDAEGISYLHVFTTQDGITSVVSIPVSVGKAGATLPAIGDLKPTPDGDKIISMPVR